MSNWEETLKGKRIDALATWWKNRKFKAAAIRFLKTQVEFALDESRWNTEYIHKPENVEKDKQVFLQVMAEIFEEEYPKMGERVAYSKRPSVEDHDRGY